VEEKQPDEAKSLTEVNKELSNPISSIWSLTFQQNTYWLTMPAGQAQTEPLFFGGHCGLPHCYGPALMIVAAGSWVIDNRLAPAVLAARFDLNDIFPGGRIPHAGRVMAAHHLALGNDRSLPIRIELSHQDNRTLLEDVAGAGRLRLDRSPNLTRMGGSGLRQRGSGTA
jgi:hypothetical protein